MLLGAATDMHALTGDTAYLALAARVLNATARRLTVAADVRRAAPLQS